MTASNEKAIELQVIIQHLEQDLDKKITMVLDYVGQLLSDKQLGVL